jgi:hypothetical protein
VATDFDAHFHAFLDSTVNLKQYRLDRLDSRVTAITNAFKNDAEIGTTYMDHSPQGSWAHGTIINPVGQLDQFDADILLHIENNPEWNDDPKTYLRQVRAAFKRDQVYKNKLEHKNRCVRISYANDCHVDVVPAITLEDGRQVIICYRDNAFEDTNPVGFADWMKERDDITGGQLRRVIRLLKWLRDFKNTFSCPSVILTVMLGGRVQLWKRRHRLRRRPVSGRSLLGGPRQLAVELHRQPTTRRRLSIFSSARTAIRAILRVGLAFPHAAACVRVIIDGGS